MTTDTKPAPLSADELRAMLDEMLPGIRAEVAANAAANVKRSMQYAMDTAVTKAINNYLSEEIVPAVKEQLEANREELIAQVALACSESARAIGERMTAQITENLSKYGVASKILEIASKGSPY